MTAFYPYMLRIMGVIWPCRLIADNQHQTSLLAQVRITAVLADGVHLRLDLAPFVVGIR